MSNTQSNTTDFEQIVSAAKNKEVFIVKHANSFPVNGKEFIMPAMTIALNERGNACLQYDRAEVNFCPNDVSIVLPNHIIKTKHISNDYDVTLIFISPSFVEDLKFRSLTNDYTKYHRDPSCQLTKEQMSKLLNVVDVMKIILEEDIKHKHDSLNYIINIFFELLNTFWHDKDDTLTIATRKNDIFNRFCDLLAKHYAESKSVAFYAEKLCLTPKYFSKIIHDIAHQSAGAWITRYVATMAKQLLATRPDLNIQDVCNLMGFNDQAAFSRYFRRATGISPKEYRDSMKKEGKN